MCIRDRYICGCETDVILRYVILQSLWEAEKHMGNVKVLVKSNPQWGVVVTENGLDIPYPNLPFFCYIFSFVYTMTNYALRGLIGQ